MVNLLAMENVATEKALLDFWARRTAAEGNTHNPQRPLKKSQSQ